MTEPIPLYNRGEFFDRIFRPFRLIVEKPITPVGQEDLSSLPISGGPLNRRDFLKLAALTITGSVIEYYIKNHPKIGLSLNALFARPLGLDRFGYDIASQLRQDIKGRELPSEFADSIWKKYFQSRATTIPESSWNTTYRRIEKAADSFYRINGVKEPFADYCTKFFDQLYQTSQEQGLDFAVLVELFGWTWKPEEIVPDSMMALPQILSSLASVAGQEDKMKEIWTEAVLPPSVATHIDGYLTLGSQDVESIVMARVFRDNPGLRQEFTGKHPHIVASLDNLLRVFDKREERRGG